MTRSHRLEIVVVTLIVVMTSLYARLAYIPSFPERRIEVAEEKYDLEIGEISPWFTAWTIGDGQAYAVIAADPSGEKLAVEIKEPIYRFTRAGYGWLAFVFSLGVEAWIPYGLAIVGVLAVIGNLVLAIRLRGRLGWGAWWLLLNPALYIGFAGDTAEPLGALLLALSLATGAWWWAAALGFTYPTFLLGLIRRWRLAVVGVGSALALGVYALIVIGTDQPLLDGGRVALPFTAYLDHPSIAGIAALVAAMATLGVGIWKRDLTFVVCGLFVLCFGDDVTRDPVNVWRAAGLLPVIWAFGPNYSRTTSRVTSLREASSVPG